MVIDPAVRRPELSAFNAIAERSPVPATYHLPAMHDMASFPEHPLEVVKGLIIFGSGASVHERSSWQVELEEWIRPLLDAGIPALGCCYGHQMLAFMYGGTVEWMFPDRHKLCGIRQVSLLSSPLGTGLVRLPISHAEVVTQLPSRFSRLAQSEDVPIDGMRHESLPIFGFQPHPEATTDFLATHKIPEDLPAQQALNDGATILDRFLALVRAS